MINLLPKTKKRAIHRMYVIRGVTIGFLLFFILGLLSVAFLAPSYFLSRAKEQAIVTEKETLDEQYEVAGIAGLEGTVQTFNQSLEQFSEERENTVVGTVLNPILSAQPASVALYTIGYEESEDGGEVELSGVAADRESLLAFSNALEEVEEFAETELPVSNLARSEDIQFELSFSVGTDPEESNEESAS